MIIYEEDRKELIIPNGIGNTASIEDAYQKGYNDGFRNGVESILNSENNNN